MISRGRLLGGLATGVGIAAVAGPSAALAGTTRISVRARPNAPEASSSAETLDALQRLGVTIPKTQVGLGMGPFGDNSLYVIGIKAGWFKDVGITITPKPYGRVTNNEQVVPQLVNNEIDFAGQWTPSVINTMVTAPRQKMVALSDIYIGLYILASPKSKAKSLSDFRAGGLPFTQALERAAAQMKGKRFGVDNKGAHKVFINTVLSLARLKASDIKITATDDSKIVQLGRGGRLDFAKPGGGPQTVQLLQDGWYPIVSISDLLSGLPGDPRVVGSVGHTGVAALADTWTKRPDTVLRFVSVMFRTADEWIKDPARVLRLELPYLESVTGAKIGLKGLMTVFAELDPLAPFEQQVEWWLRPQSPFYYRTIYNAQIKDLQRNRVLPKRSLDASQAIIGAEVYKKLLSYKTQYESLVARSSSLTGARALAGREAHRHYTNRNYLDAARILRAAVGR